MSCESLESIISYILNSESISRTTNLLKSIQVNPSQFKVRCSSIRQARYLHLFSTLKLKMASIDDIPNEILIQILKQLTVPRNDILWFSDSRELKATHKKLPYLVNKLWSRLLTKIWDDEFKTGRVRVDEAFSTAEKEDEDAVIAHSQDSGPHQAYMIQVKWNRLMNLAEEKDNMMSLAYQAYCMKGIRGWTSQ